jgi:hypothetical protein
VSNAGAIRAVELSRAWFSPARGQTTEILLTVAEVGKATVLLLDRDGVPVRRLAVDREIAPGKLSLVWDGRDDSGRLVPDEAYSLKIDFASSTGEETYFPAREKAEQVHFAPEYYSRQEGVMRYTLLKAARVRVEAILGKYMAGRIRGPVAATIVDGEPRTAGQIVEYWNGFDRLGAVQISTLPDFALVITADFLPENAIITTGNRKVSLVGGKDVPEGGAALLDPAPCSSMSEGLPSMTVRLSGANRSSSTKAWQVGSGDALHLSCSLAGPTVSSFVAGKGALKVYLDGRELDYDAPEGTEAQVDVPMEDVSEGGHLIVVNWVNGCGNVVARCLPIDSARRTE